MTELFDIGLEADLSEFDSTVTDGGDLSQSGSAALAGTSGGMAVLIDDTTAIYGRKDFSSTTRFRFRLYIDPNSLTMASGDAFVWLRTDNTEIEGWLRNDSGTYRILFKAREDAAWQNTGYHNITDEPHYIEVDWKASSTPGANDGFLNLYIDDNLKSSLTSLDNDTFAIVYLRVGVISGIDAGTSGTFYIDEIKANDDGAVIGAFVSGGFMTTNRGYW